MGGKNLKQPFVVEFAVSIKAPSDVRPPSSVRRINEHRHVLCTLIKQSLHYRHTVTLLELYAIRELADGAEARHKRLRVPSRSYALSILTLSDERCSRRQNTGSSRAIQHQRTESTVDNIFRGIAFQIADPINGRLKRRDSFPQLGTVMECRTPEGCDIGIELNKYRTSRPIFLDCC